MSRTVQVPFFFRDTELLVDCIFSRGGEDFEIGDITYGNGVETCRAAALRDLIENDPAALSKLHAAANERYRELIEGDEDDYRDEEQKR